ncbi:hypothetical protein [Brevundimonas sp.]|uniref:hypothetical protein n=1 Tax=Brevundimonas sp. TaxID=1871086 RepID=UPI003D6C7B72
MKRRIVVAWAGAALVLAGCNAPVERSQDEEARQDGGWTAAPRISAVERQGAGLVVRGDASPRARVVLRGDQEAAFAAGADESGRFELRVGALPSAMLLTPEVQIGQFPAPGPEQLVLANEEAMLAALLIQGGASRRLSPGPALDSVDGDGHGLVVSGRAGPGARISVSAEGGAAVEVVADSSGRWTAALPGVGDRAANITVGGASFAYPGPAAGEGVGRIERSGGGWRLTRLLSPSARQTSWFPDA